jgi:signal transduction histidine kinase
LTHNLAVASLPDADVERLLRQLEALRAVIESIGSGLALRPLLTRILDLACELIGAPYGSIGLYDEADDVIETTAIHGLPEQELGVRLAPGVGLAGRVLLTRQPVLMARYGDLPQVVWPELKDHPVLGIPILWRDTLVGFVGIGAAAGRRFERRDVETLTLFARHAAVAIENARRHAAEQARSRRFALIARVAHIITAGFALDELLQNAADAIHELLGYPNVDIPLLEPGEPGALIVRARGGHYKKQIAGEDRLPLTRGIMAAAVRERKTQLVHDVAKDPRYVRPPAEAEAVRAELAVPILLGEQVLGVVNVETDGRLDQDDAAGLQVVADHLAVAIRNARLYERAQQVAILEERQRLARDLHDSVTQLLFSVTLLAQSIGPAWRRDPAEGERQVERVLELSRSALAEMRALLLELRPADDRGSPQPQPAQVVSARIRRDGLAGALRQHAAEVAANGLQVSVQAEGYDPQRPEREEALYRIAQEALCNVVKHARARAVSVSLGGDRGHVSLTIRDDGAGFDAEAAFARAAAGASGAGGFGLVSMRERAEALRGALRIDSRPGAGTRVVVTIPRDPPPGP